jgi:hypothetical protein
MRGFDLQLASQLSPPPTEGPRFRQRHRPCAVPWLIIHGARSPAIALQARVTPACYHHHRQARAGRAVHTTCTEDSSHTQRSLQINNFETEHQAVIY